MAVSPTFNSVNAYSLAEMGQFYMDSGRKTLANFINLLAKDDPILDHAIFRQGQTLDGFQGKLISRLPEVYWTRLYKGVPYSKSGVATVKETARQLSTKWGADVREMRLYEGQAAQNAFRMLEGAQHIEALQQQAAETMFYGNPTENPDEFRGLAAHYPTRTSPNVIDAGGTSGDMTSIWGIVWGEKLFHGFYPQNMPAGIQYQDKGIGEAFDDDGNTYDAVRDQWDWYLGFFLANWRSVVRICNIPVEHLTVTDPTSANYIDFQKLTVQAKNKIPVRYRRNMRWYCSETTATALELQNLTGSKVQLNLGQQFAAQGIDDGLTLHRRPVYQCDSLLETESRI